MRSLRARLGRLGWVALVLSLPLGLLLAVWGGPLARVIEGQGGTIMRRSVEVAPLEWFWTRVPDRNLTAVPWPVLVVLALALSSLLVMHAHGASRGRREASFGRAALACYALAIFVGPFAVGWVLMPSAVYEFELRYFAFSTPALAVLLVLSFEQLLVLIDRLQRSTRVKRLYLEYSLLFTLVALLLVLPGTYRAAASTKVDWRGTAQLIDDVIRADPKHQYVLYATGYTTYPSLDYYFERMGSEAKVSKFLRLTHDKKNGGVLDRERKTLAEHDFLIVSFTHVPAARFQRTVRALEERYAVHQAILQDGRGIVIYRLRPAKARAR